MRGIPWWGWLLAAWVATSAIWAVVTVLAGGTLIDRFREATMRRPTGDPLRLSGDNGGAA